MKCATFNVNSIRARLPRLLEWLGENSPDILCLQETKVQDKDFPVEPLKEAGYHTSFRGQKSYNGVAILSRSPMEPVDPFPALGQEGEARLVMGKWGDLLVVNAYVPQGVEVGSEKFQYKLSWLEGLGDYIASTCDPRAPLLVAGDFNVALEPEDVFDPKGMAGGVGFHPDEQARLRRLLDWGLVDVFRKHVQGGGHYTFWDYRIPNGLKRNLGWRIDYILASAPVAEKSRKAWIDVASRGLPKPSDHTFLVAEFDLEG